MVKIVESQKIELKSELSYRYVLIKVHENEYFYGLAICFHGWSSKVRKEFEFTVKGHQIKVVNSWGQGTKLYIDGEYRDQDSSIIASGKNALLSANLGEFGILEIFPLSALISVEMDAFLITNNEKQQVYSSHKRLNLKEQRLAK